MASRRTRRIGRYHLTDRIAFGGMAEIFRGFTFDEAGYRREVAIKKLLPNYVEDVSFVNMLTDEYRIVSHMNHLNVAKVYELVRIQDTILVSMEFVDGKDLRATVDRGRDNGNRLGYADVVYIMASALAGLHHAHLAVDSSGVRLDVVHRDFSPSNVLVAYDGTVKLIDFGIAKANENKVETKTGIIKGKVKYMSPEQAFGHKLDSRSDVFSAGSVLYELTTGRSPFRARSEIDLIFEVREATPRPPLDVNPNLPPGLAQIIEKSMARERDDRYQSGSEFRDALVDFLREYAPDYRRSRLARYMKRLWADEIEKELRDLEEWALDLPQGPDEDLGENLIAASLGQSPEYRKFSPNPTQIIDPAADRIAPNASEELEFDPYGLDDPTHVEPRRV